MLVYLQMIETDEDKFQFEQLYLKYRWLMYSVANRIVENKQDAEDAVHQAFVSIAENLHKVYEVDCPETKAYVVIISERKAIDIMRSNSRYSKAEAFDDLAGIQIETQFDDELSDAIAKLPARYREVILLRFAYGYSTKEIGRMIGLTQANVQRTLHRAKSLLQKKLEEDGAAYEKQIL